MPMRDGITIRPRVLLVSDDDSYSASLKRQLAGVIIVLGWLFFIEQALAALFPGVTDYLAGPSVFGIVGHGGGDLPSFPHALAVTAVYAAGLGVVAITLTRRRDIT